MNKLSKEKREMLIAICMGAAVLMGVLYFYVAKLQEATQASIQKKKSELYDRMTQADAIRKTAPDVTSKLQLARAEIEKREAGLAAERDTYSWMVQTISPFILQRKNVNIPGISQAVIGPDTMVTRSPYKVATFKMKGIGFYHDFGKFFADFENAYPYFRIQNWEMTPAGGGSGTDGEKLNVTFEIIAPIRAAAEAAK